MTLDRSAQILLPDPLPTSDVELARLVETIVIPHADAAQAVAYEAYLADRRLAGLPDDYRPTIRPYSDAKAGSLVGWAKNLSSSEAGLTGLIVGGISKRINGAARELISGATVQDRSARGWQRVARGTSCRFCQMLAGRGAVYTQASSRFASHDNCGCMAVPAWDGKPVPVAAYTPSDRDIPESQKRQVKKWLADNAAMFEDP